MSDRDLDGDGFGALEYLPPRGHNRPPSLLLDEALVADIENDSAFLFARADELAGAESRMPPVDGPTNEAKATEFVRQIQAAVKAIDAARIARKEPYRRGASQVDSRFNIPTDALEKLKKRVEARLTEYKRAVAEAARAKAEAEAKARREAEEKAAAERRRAQEEAERKEREAREAAEAAARKRSAEARAKAEAEARRAADAAEVARKQREAAEEAERVAAEARHKAEKLAEAPAAEHTRRRSTSAVSSLQEFVDFRDLDRRNIDLDKLREHFTTDAIETAVRAYARANSDMIKAELKNARQPLRGIVFWINARTNVR